MSIIIRTISDQVVNIVRDRIIAGLVPVGTPIRQDALAAELGISKIPLREALARLEQDGLLESQPNRGYFVRSMTRHELEEVFSLRLKLEPDAVAAGSRAATKSHHKRAKVTLDDFKDAANAHSLSSGTRNRAFHVALIEPSGDRVTNDFVTRLNVLADRYVSKHLEPLGRNERADKEHHDILTAWLNADLDKVRDLTINHIANTLRDLREQLVVESLSNQLTIT
jgi:DNA-binding GntR family transcriptional regulator